MGGFGSGGLVPDRPPGDPQGAGPAPGPLETGPALRAPAGGPGAGAGSEFARKAAKIGAGIHSTSTKLARLAQLAKRTSMFDDPAQEINEMTSVIKQDIQTLNSAIAELQSAASTKEGSFNKQSSKHTSTVVDNLRNRLKNATQEFKGVLTMRTDNLKVNEQRRKVFSSGDSAGPHSPFTPLLATSGPGSGADGGLPGGGGAPAGLGAGLGGGALLQQQIAAPQESYMASRAEALKNVESTLLELGGIFEQLSHMVAAQGEVAIRIDEDVEETLHNVEGAQTQLLKYLESISSNRWLIMKIFAVLILFAVIFVVFVA